MPAKALDALGKVCADARPAEETDAADGLVPAYVAAPATLDEASGLMRVAAEYGLRVIARGGATKLGWGRPPAAGELVVDTRRLDRVIDHAAGDLVAKVEAGITVTAFQEVLAGKGQQLALDSALPGATVGGTLATATAGPRRLLYGTARDLLIGITIVRADGAVASAGGKVVKNVAGYDLGKLLTGSYGTLGLIVTAAFRLHPLPATRAFVTTTVPDARSAALVAGRLLHSPLVPAAVEIDRPGPDGPVTVTTLLEGVAAGTAARAAAAADLMGETGTTPEVTGGPPPWWGHYPGYEPAHAPGPGGTAAADVGPRPGPDEAGQSEAGPGEAGSGGGRTEPAGGVLIQVNAPPSAVVAVLDTAARAGLDAGHVRVRGSAGTGVVHAGLPRDTTPEAAGAFLDRLRERLRPSSGSATVLEAPRAVREAVDLWGPVPALPLMRRIKHEFDPGRLLAPGRFVGGI